MMVKILKVSSIKILEKENNKRGDLFGRLMSDLFLALGYDDIRLNIHKTGREIDIEAKHRTEKRQIIAECKATKEKIGGKAINNFIGALDAEKRKKDFETIGYFISLSGFRETAIEQEKEVGEERVILVNGIQVIEELINGHIIVSPEIAMERAGRCAAGQSDNLIPEATELLAHEIGWIWAIYFSQNKQRTHFALIHADGEALSPILTEQIIESDKSIGGDLHSLQYLSPSGETISDNKIKMAKEKYFEYLSKECGEITLEGLPADQQVGFQRLNLENIFVPLYLNPFIEARYIRSSESSEIVEKNGYIEERKSVGKILSKQARLAILAGPGGGKTTLLKRLAIAYAFPDRRKSLDDNLPDRKWFPLLIRCRQLDNLASSSINNILSSIPNWAEMNDLAEPFSLLVCRALRDGEILLLVDGLDEISDEGKRITFIKQLRTFLAVYPTVSIIVTSREAGFRIVGGALSTYCRRYRIADFDDDDITRLTLAWHKEVVGDQEKVRLDAEKLAKTICETERVRELAKNPLLLTTLLLVKRWAGQLPSSRSVLYGKALEVLLMTWNVEGYEPIDQDEAIPQLAFIAFTMMKEGVQRISSRRLKELLRLARKQMPEVLGYARISVSEFVKRVELRSSILVLSGHQIEQGTLYPIYEFRHKTFQEYLAARAVENGYYPDRKDEDSILSILKPHLKDENWKEVVSLSAVLAGRKVGPLIEYLIEECKKMGKPSSPYKFSPVTLLGQCFLDGVQVAPHILEEGLEWIARRSKGQYPLIRALYQGKYGETLLEVVQNAYTTSTTDLLDLGSILGIISLEQMEFHGNLEQEIFKKILNLLNNDNSLQKAAGALAVMEIAFLSYSKDFHPRRKTNQNEKELLNKLRDEIVPFLYSEKSYIYFAASWALAWLGKGKFWSPKHNPDVLSRLLTIWRESTQTEIQRQAAWAISNLPIIDRELNPLQKPDQKIIEFIKKWYSIKEGPFEEKFRKRASLVIGFYLEKPWTDEDLAKFVAREVEQDEFPFRWENGVTLLKKLGKPGRMKLKKLKEKETKRKEKYRIRKPLNNTTQ
jgi:hypothetical protein